MISLVGKLIKHNQCLLHLDLSGTGLEAKLLLGIAEALRKAKSLLSVHLSGNPGLTDQVQDTFVQRIRARPNEDVERFVRIQNLVKKVTSKIPKNTSLEGVQHMIDRQ